MARRRVAGQRVLDMKQWRGLPAHSSGVASITTVLMASLGFTEPSTILRIRGDFRAMLDGASDGTVQQFAFGIGVVSTDAATLGATAMPDPFGEPEYPWLFYHSANLVASILGGALIEPALAQAFVTIDSKAMRRVKPGQSLVSVLQTLLTSNTTIDHGLVRVLVGT